MVSADHSIGWVMFAVVSIACIASISLIFWLRFKHPDTFTALGGHSIWTSAQFRYLGFIWQFRYLSLRDPVATLLGVLTQLASILALYLIFWYPRYYFGEH